MSTREHLFRPDRIYFITFTVYKWQSIFISSKYISLFFKWFDYQKQNYGNKIHGYVIMPNHFHGLIFISKNSPDISKLIQNGKRFLAYQIIQLLNIDNNYKILSIFREGADKNKKALHKVFENGFDSKIIENESLFREKLNYIHNNPCQKKWNLADTPENYPYSSASNYIFGQGLYDVDVLHLRIP